MIRKAQSYLRRKLPTLAVVTVMDAATGRVTYTLEGVTRREEFARIPPKARAARTVGVDGWVEPLSLFVGRSGLPPSQRRWHQYFAEANDRIGTFEGRLPAMPAVTPHDLRHTFAIVMLAQLAGSRWRSLNVRGRGTALAPSVSTSFTIHS